MWGIPTGSLIEEKGSLEEEKTGPEGAHSFPHPALLPSTAVDLPPPYFFPV